VFGVDASWSEVERAGLLAEQHADQPDRLGFALANESDLSAIEHDREESGAYDALVLGEILEHVIDPVELLTRLERMVQPGGVVVITMPYGPWATNKPEWERGQHLREWDVGDLRDVLHGKASLIIDRVPNGTCPVSGEILGFTVASYTADQKSLGQLDWSRKLTMHRPRQTLSVTMIVGGATAHETLHWCLASVMPAADELVVADCGITPEARRILEQHDARIVPGSNPLSEGFETPRNLSLAACREDWALMIDSDERLLSAATMWPYLRENCYHTYAIPQHHFAVDSNWKPDMPGRLFRRRPDEEGRTLRVIGKLHEHPEFAPNAGAGRAIVMHNVRIAHVGYLEQAIRAERFVRNLPLLQRDLEAYPDRKLGLLVLCRDSVIQAKWLTLISGRDPNQPGCALGNAQVANLCRDVVRVWERAFMADDSHMSNESMEHYHEACKMLGTDVVANAGISVQRQGIGGSVGNGAQHFASIEHFEAYMAGRLKAAVAPLSGDGF
jgi:hypothetical protein